MAFWFILIVSRSSLKIKIGGQSSRSQEESVIKVVGATFSDGFLVAFSTKVTRTWRCPAGRAAGGRRWRRR